MKVIGFRPFFRRSKKFGPFRLNFTKRGVGLSAGVAGARYSVHSTGRTTKTVGIPGTGVYLREQTTPHQPAKRRKPRRRERAKVEPVPTTHPPGWLSDPTKRFQWRWWSGKDWTEHVASQGRQATDPVHRDAS